MKSSASTHATCYFVFLSPVGELLVLANEKGITGLYFEKRFAGSLEDLREQPTQAILVEAKKQLGAYFAAERNRFDLPLDAVGTEFQRAVWEQLSLIPHGETRSYGEIADRIGNPKAVRAVGLANGANPISIIVPCHRVIGASGKLTGFGGGLERKRQLLEHEGILLGVGA